MQTNTKKREHIAEVLMEATHRKLITTLKMNISKTISITKIALTSSSQHQFPETEHT